MQIARQLNVKRYHRKNASACCLLCCLLAAEKSENSKYNILKSMNFFLAPSLYFFINNKMFMVGDFFNRSVGNLKPTYFVVWPETISD